MNLFGTWIAAGLTIAILSFLYRDNPLYKFAEHLFVGVSAGYWVIYIWAFDVKPMLIDEFFGQAGVEKWILIIPALFGVMMIMRWFPGTAGISRWPISFTVGIAAGLALTAQVQGYIIPQIQATLFSLISIGENATETLGQSINNIVIFVGVVCALLFFYFSREHKGALKVGSKIGIVFLMIGFGASFGYTVMARISLLIGRITFLLQVFGIR
ncbi:MAG: hypothetical protein JSV97_04545 [candidate division WOR-3 bacterium]|nr:MAG: hypothetical protein JSV97_04545 [candidate division WOR-3 bacterium]